ncbi:MAG: hypothetical protein P8M15_00240 [Alphaproteobacteria bacterium]|nr:hypothetical protein [Alphaproteobacteria bacterium]
MSQETCQRTRRPAFGRDFTEGALRIVGGGVLMLRLTFDLCEAIFYS